ncbi:hypothetical protein KY361_07480 [Candidatus Woesearchaeota archaeon]|nr:hypothetical protein [Candidatus Woesearchaeota archaeon]
MEPLNRNLAIAIILFILFLVFYFLFRKRKAVERPEVLKRPAEIVKPPAEVKRPPEVPKPPKKVPKKPSLPTKAYEEFEKAKKDIEDIEKRIKPIGKERAEAIEPYVEEFRLDISDLLKRLLKLEQDKRRCEEQSERFIKRVRAGTVTPYNFSKEALKLNLRYQHVLKADLKTVKQVVLELKLDIAKFERKIAVYLPGGAQTRRILLDLRDLMSRFIHIEEFFVKDISNVEIPLP